MRARLLSTRPERLSNADRARLRAHRALADAYETRWRVVLF